MPLPKRRHSKQRRDKSRTHLALKGAALVVCSSCGQTILPYVVCKFCGYYKGKKVLEIKQKEDKKKKK